MLKEFVEIKGHEDYEISAEGKVRKVDTKKYKNQLMDRRRRHAVALPIDDGGMEVIYIQTLIEENFTSEDVEEYLKVSGEEKLPAYESILKKYQEAAAKVAELEATVATSDSTATSKKSSTGKRCKKIKNMETGEIFNSFAEAAKHYGTTYDKFYDSIYNRGEFNGQKFERI